MNQVRVTRHLIVRYADLYAPSGGTVAAHKAVLKRLGFVWLAKFGRTIGASRIAAIDAQARSEVPTYVFLVKKEAGHYLATACKIERCVKELTGAERKYIPDYYRSTWSVGAWFKVVEMEAFPPSALNRLIVVSSARPVSEVLSGSMAGAFIVRAEGDIAAMIATAQ